MKKLISLKETRLFVALALLVQSIAFFIMFLILCAKKKSVAAAFLAVSAMEGIGGVYLLSQEKEDALAEEEEFELEELDLDEEAIASNLAHGVDGAEEEVPDDHHEILCEEHVSEEEFQ